MLVTCRKALAAITVLAGLLPQLSRAQCGDPMDSTLCVYRLDAIEESQFSDGDGLVSAFWSDWAGRDSALLTTDSHSHSTRNYWSGLDDAQLVVKAAGTPNALYLCVRVADNHWTPGFRVFDFATLWLDTMSSAQQRACNDCLFGLYGSSITYSGPGYGL